MTINSLTGAGPYASAQLYSTYTSSATTSRPPDAADELLRSLDLTGAAVIQVS